MKKAFSVLLAIAMVLVCVPLGAIATVLASSYGDGYYNYRIEGDGAVITGVSTAISGDVTIPAAFPFGEGEIPVIAIDFAAFRSCNNMTSVTIPGSISTIGEAAFHMCENLTAVTIGEGVTTIADSAFNGCSSLQSVVIPDSVTSIGKQAFVWCDSLTTAVIGDGVVTIGDGAFTICPSLTSVTIGDSVTTISNNAFANCPSLASVTIGDSVTTIGNGAFADCTSLTSVTIPDSVTTIGAGAFRSCTALADIFVGGNVTSIGGQAFYGSAFYEDKSNWSDEGLYIGNYFIASSGAYNRSCTLREGTRVIAAQAFYYCRSLQMVTIPDSVVGIGREAFYHCDDLTAVIIPEGVTCIEYGTFEMCSRLESITIPNSVTTIEYCAFWNACVTEVIYCGTEEQWDAISIDSANDALKNATRRYHDRITATCTTTEVCIACGETLAAALGHSWADNACSRCETVCVDANGDSHITIDDAVYLLYYTMLPEQYPLTSVTDVNGDGDTDGDDAIYLLYYCLLPDLYPLK